MCYSRAFAFCLMCLVAVFIAIYLYLRSLKFVLLCGIGAILACFWMHLFCQLPTNLPSKGCARISIMHCVEKRGIYGNSEYVYTGVIKQFDDFQGRCIARNIPFTVRLPRKKKIFPANREYNLQEILLQKGRNGYQLKWQPTTDAQPRPYSFSLADFRLRMKKRLKKHLMKHYPSRDAEALIAGLATAEFSDSFMLHTFSRLGLSHLLAISGFHFTILANTISLILNLFLYAKKRHIALLICATFYLLFIGPMPSIYRAFIMSAVSLSAIFFKRLSQPINALGISIIIMCSIYPFWSVHLGFQLSCLCTLAILLLYKPIDKWLQKIPPMTNQLKTVQNFCRQALSVGLSVNLLCMPVILYYFRAFYPLSLIYNIIFPLVFSIILLLLILGLLCDMVFPPVGQCIHWVNHFFVQKLIQGTYAIPRSLDWKVGFSSFSKEYAITYLALILIFGIYWQEKKSYEEPFWLL